MTRRGTRQRGELVDAMLTEDPTRSDRSIARAVAVHHTTVANHRRRLELAGTLAARPSRAEAANARVMVEQEHGGSLSWSTPGNVKNGSRPERRAAYRPLKAQWLALYQEKFPGEDADDLEQAAAWKARVILRERELDELSPRGRRWESVNGDLTRLEALLDRKLAGFRTSARRRAQAAPEDELAAEVALIHAARGNGDG